MANCATCRLPLVLEIECDEENHGATGVGSTSSPETVPDDVELACMCHFHWHCLLDSYQLTKCPNCAQNISSISMVGVEQILCNLNNEGGLQEALDILPLLTEESYLRAYPEERKPRAFLKFCREGDVQAIVDLLDDDDDDGDHEDDDEDGQNGQAFDPRVRAYTRAAKVLKYQDPLESMYSGLHIAVINEKVEVIWLILLVASGLDMQRFPTQVLHQANKIGAVRLFKGEGDEGMVDARLLKDSNGQTAAQHTVGSNLKRLFDGDILHWST